MKKIGLIIITLLAGLGANAQEDAVSKYFSSYLDDENFTKVSVTSRMFSLFTDIETGDENEEEFLEAISKLKGLKVISGDSITGGMAKYRSALSTVKGKGYEELMSVRDGNDNFEFMIKEKDKIITELLMIAGADDSFHVMTLYGEIDLKKITSLASKMKIDALDHLRKLDGHKEDGN
ncbi:MAG: DUF4252 domain-containing protein [Cyclobacteriaceae bacterium]